MTKRLLQVELLRLQTWMRSTGSRAPILCEGRDAAGKGGSLKRFMEHLNARVARVVALEKPTSSVVPAVRIPVLVPGPFVRRISSGPSSSFPGTGPPHAA